MAFKCSIEYPPESIFFFAFFSSWASSFVFFCCLNWSVWLSEGLNSTFYSLRFWVSTSLRTWTSTFTASVVWSSMESSKCWISASSLTHNIPIVVWRNYTLPPFSIYLHWLVPWLGRNRIKRIFWSRVNRFQVTGKFFFNISFLTSLFRFNKTWWYKWFLSSELAETWGWLRWKGQFYFQKEDHELIL